MIQNITSRIFFLENEFDKQTVSHKPVIKSKKKQILDNYEQECNEINQSSEQKTYSSANVYDDANENLDNKADSNDNNNGIFSRLSIECNNFNWYSYFILWIL